MWSKVGFYVEIVGSISSRCKVVTSGFPLHLGAHNGVSEHKKPSITIGLRLEDFSERFHEERKDRCNAITRGRWEICLVKAKQTGTDPGCIRYCYRGDFRYHRSSDAPWCPSDGICVWKPREKVIMYVCVHIKKKKIYIYIYI